MKNFVQISLLLLATIFSTSVQAQFTATPQYVTYEWCEVRAANFCKFAFKDLFGTFDHVEWGSGNFSFTGSHQGPFTPQIVWKRAEFFDSAVGVVKSVDSKRDVYTCKAEISDSGTYYDTRCEYLNVPGRLFRVENLPSTRGSAISRKRGNQLKKFVPNGACVLMYLTEYEVLDTSVSPPKVRYTVSMPARQARIENNCVLFYGQF